MNKINCALATLVLGIAANGSPADAQSLGINRGSTLDSGVARLRVTQSTGTAENAGGTIVAPGIVLNNEGSVEFGYDSNPDELYINPRSALYSLASAGSSLAFVRPAGATVVLVRGSSYNLSDSDTRRFRGDVGAAVDSVHRLGGGFEVAFGGYFLYDTVRLVESEQGGGYAKLAFNSANLEAYARVREQAIKYLGDVPFPETFAAASLPFAANSAFNVRRTEETAGVLRKFSPSFAVFADIGAAQLDYFDQPMPSALDREASEYWGVSGIRLTSGDKTFTADLGYRYNRREFRNHVNGSAANSFPEIRLAWLPTTDFSVTFDVQRLFVEPVTTFGLVGDETTYGVTVNYQLTPAVDFAFKAHDRRTVEIGDTAVFREKLVGLLTTYRINDKFQLYGTVQHKRVDEETSHAQFDRTYGGVGLKMKF